MKALIILCLLSISANALCQEANGKIINVIDGNTLEVKNEDGQTQKLVLQGVDCPELGQAYGDKAKIFMEKLILNKEVTYKVMGKDRWGNYLAVVMKGHTDPRVELLEEGLAWTAEKNPLPEFETIRLKALERSKGLWKDEKPTPPWTWRREQSMMQAKSN